MSRPSLARDEALLSAVLAALGHRVEGHGSTRPWMRARLRARVSELGLEDEAYVARLADDDAERRQAARCVACAMSRMWRGGKVLEALRRVVLPGLAAQARALRAWSAGAARGEEAYTLAMLWLELDARSGATLEIVASDIRADSLERAREARFEHGALREVPRASLARWFEATCPNPGPRTELRVGAEARGLVRFLVHDLERDPWLEQVDLLLLRTVAFTYWGEALQRQALERARDAVRPGGWLAIGRRETLPEGGEQWFEALEPGLSLFRRRDQLSESRTES